MSFRVPRELRTRIEEEADATGRTLASEVEHLIELGMTFRMLLRIAYQQSAAERGD